MRHKMGPVLKGEGEFGTWLARIMEREKISRDELAEMIGTDPKVVTNAIHCKTRPSKRTVIAICWALDRLPMLDYALDMVLLDWPDS